MEQKIKVGDRVRVVNYSDANINGRIGTVVYEMDPYTVLVDIENFSEGHCGGGRLKTNSGWWVGPENLELIEQEPKFKVGDRVKDKKSGEDGLVMRIDGNYVKVGWDDGSWFDEESATWWPMDDFELIETAKKNEWPKIIATSRFYSECNGSFGFEVTNVGLTDTNEDLWVKLDEIPAFVEWLQTEYKRRKGE